MSRRRFSASSCLSARDKAFTVQSSAKPSLPKVHFWAFRNCRLKNKTLTNHFSVCSTCRQPIILIGRFESCAGAWLFVLLFFFFSFLLITVMITIWKEQTRPWSENQINSLCTWFKAVGICRIEDGCILNNLIIDPSHTELFHVDVITVDVGYLFRLVLVEWCSNGTTLSYAFITWYSNKKHVKTNCVRL